MRSFAGQSMMTRRRQLGDAFLVINSPSMQGKIKHFFYAFVCQTSWAHRGERGGKEKRNNKPEPKIAQHCVGRMTKLWHSGDRLGDSILSLHIPASREVYCFHFFPFSLSLCFPHVNIYIVVYCTSILDVFPHLDLPGIHPGLLLGRAVFGPAGTCLQRCVPRADSYENACGPS